MPFTQHSLPIGNGTSLVLRVFDPPAEPRASVIVSAAMGVPQTFYGPFAEWLSQQGFSVITFDYRGIGLSAPPSLRGYAVTLMDWGRQDCAAVIDFVKAKQPHAPLYWVGHSLGGQLLGLIPNRAQIERAMTVGTGNGYWREVTFGWLTLWVWYVMVPLATRIVGYFPGKRLRKIGNLPLGVIEQWRRWCLHPRYAVGVEGEAVRASFESVRMPILALSFTDDELMTASSIPSLHGLFTNAPVEHRRLSPRDFGLRRIGHFGFFRAQYQDTMWPLVPQWITSP
jgi:predicted alpha/beta hydrolase